MQKKNCKQAGYATQRAQLTKAAKNAKKTELRSGVCSFAAVFNCRC